MNNKRKRKKKKNNHKNSATTFGGNIQIATGAKASRRNPSLSISFRNWI
jgi:hypothetical protein